MGLLGLIVLGLIAGILAKIIMPGDDSNNPITTIILGMIGAWVGGFLSSMIFKVSILSGSFGDAFKIQNILIATAGAFLVLFLWKKIRGR